MRQCNLTYESSRLFRLDRSRRTCSAAVTLPPGYHMTPAHRTSSLPPAGSVTLAVKDLLVRGPYQTYADHEPRNGDYMTGDYEERLRAKLAPETTRVILSYAGLVLLVYEELKREIVDEVRAFYTRGEKFDQAAYDRDVRSLDNSKYKSSARWLLKSGAITADQIDVLERLYEHRKDVSHELLKYLIDVDSGIDADLFTQAIGVLKDIRRFWTQVELNRGLIGISADATVDEVVPVSSLVLQNILDAWVDGVKEERRRAQTAREGGEPA